MLNPYRFGLIAEIIVIISLKFRFYKIRAWRYKNKCGEIDIIATRGKKIIFFEVKARKNKVRIDDLISDSQIRRIHNSAEIFVAKNNQLQKYMWQFDFIEVNRYFFYKHHYNFIS